MAKGTAAFHGEKREEEKQKKNIAGWEQQRTGRQKPKLREALLGSDYNRDQEAGGATEKGNGNPNGSPAVN